MKIILQYIKLNSMMKNKNDHENYPSRCKTEFNNNNKKKKKMITTTITTKNENKHEKKTKIHVTMRIISL